MAQAQPNTSCVEIVEVCRVAPPPVQHLSASSYTDPPKSLPLTFFDLRWLRSPPPQRLYFYEIPTQTSTTCSTTTNTHSLFFDSILPRLKRSATREAIKSLEIKGQLLNGAENLVSSMTRDMYSPTTHVAVARRRVYTIVASPRFEFYGTDFGWGRPRKVDVVTTDRTGGISVSDTRSSGDGGVEIGLVLEKHHMEVFASIFTQGLESL